jgi:hypothetical protein
VGSNPTLPVFVFLGWKKKDFWTRLEEYMTTNSKDYVEVVNTSALTTKRSRNFLLEYTPCVKSVKKMPKRKGVSTLSADSGFSCDLMEVEKTRSFLNKVPGLTLVEDTSTTMHYSGGFPTGLDYKLRVHLDQPVTALNFYKKLKECRFNKGKFVLKIYTTKAGGSSRGSGASLVNREASKVEGSVSSASVVSADSVASVASVMEDPKLVLEDFLLIFKVSYKKKPDFMEFLYDAELASKRLLGLGEIGKTEPVSTTLQYVFGNPYAFLYHIHLHTANPMSFVDLRVKLDALSFNDGAYELEPYSFES